MTEMLIKKKKLNYIKFLNCKHKRQKRVQDKNKNKKQRQQVEKRTKHCGTAGGTSVSPQHAYVET